MSNKPMSVAEFLTEGLPKVPDPPGILLANRYEVLRERSVSSRRGPSPRPPKRKKTDSEGEEGGAEGEDGRFDPNKPFRSMEEEEASFAKAKGIEKWIRETLEGATEEDMNPKLKKVLESIVDWMEITTGVQKTTASVVVDSFAKVASPRKSRDGPRGGREGGGKPAEEVACPEDRAKEERKKKFMNEVREAEKSTLVFRTNMGSVPVMNTETMRKRFTADVTVKAAAVENCQGGRPSSGVISQLDDTLSMITKMEYFGKVTKKATRMNADKVRVEEDFYTIPVKLVFKDKTTREAAEGRLRNLCKISSTTPYHRTLRNAINKIIGESKEKYEGNFIQAKLVPDKMQVKISRRDENKRWFDDVEIIDLRSLCWT
jgi:hypothetical protein